MAKSKKTSNRSFSFEKSMERLEEIVERLEQGDLTLEESLKDFEEGVNLVKGCRQYLEEASQKVEILVSSDKDGPVIDAYEEDVDEEEEDED